MVVEDSRTTLRIFKIQGPTNFQSADMDSDLNLTVTLYTVVQVEKDFDRLKENIATLYNTPLQIQSLGYYLQDSRQVDALVGMLKNTSEF